MPQRDRRDILTFLLVVSAAGIGMLLLRPTDSAPPTRVPVPLADSEKLHPTAAFVDLSSDASFMVYVSEAPGGGRALRTRRFGEATGRLVRDSEGARDAAVSPDGTEVAFTAGELPAPIRIVELEGRASRTVEVAVGHRGVRWSPDGRWIYFTDADSGLSRVPTTGGTAEVVTRVDDRMGVLHWAPEPLPGGGAVVYTSTSDAGDSRIEVIDSGSGTVTDLWAGRVPRYTATGHLLFADGVDSTLIAARLDPDSPDRIEAPVAVTPALAYRADWPLFAVSRRGHLIVARPVDGSIVSPAWVDRAGSTSEVVSGWSYPGHPIYSSLALSPNDDRLAVSIPHVDGPRDLWIMSLDSSTRGVPERFTFEGGLNYRATWLPDGRSLTYISERAGQADLWMQSVNDSTSAERILDRPVVIRNGSVSPDGAWIVFREGEAPQADIFRVPFAAPSTDARSAEPQPVVVTPAGERSPTLSPDGRWLAYTSNEAGRWHVWLAEFGSPVGRRWLVSPDGGEEPAWSRDGSELFYRDWANRLVSVGITDDPDSPVGLQHPLFSMEGFLASDGRAQYDVSADGERFVMLRRVAGGDVELILIENFAAALDSER